MDLGRDSEARLIQSLDEWGDKEALQGDAECSVDVLRSPIHNTWSAHIKGAYPFTKLEREPEPEADAATEPDLETPADMEEGVPS